MTMRDERPLITRRTAMALTAAGFGACSIPQDNADQSEQQPDASDMGNARPCWTEQSPLPFAVQEIYPIAHAGRIHLAGGLLGQDGRVVGVSDRHIAYDPTSGTTETLGALPSARHHPQLVSTGEQLYCLGGFETTPNAVNWIMTDQTLIYDNAGRWSPLADAPEAHAETVATALGGHIHIVGGRRNTVAENMGYGDHADSDSHLVFDPSSNIWQRVAPALTKRNSAAGAVINGLWHVVGGRQVSGGPLDTHEVYDPAEDRWRTAAPLPAGIGAGGNAAGVIEGKLYAFGGEYFSGGEGGVHEEVCAYDPATDAWEVVGELITPRHGLGGVTLAGAIYAVGGAIRPSGNGTSTAVERLSLSCA